MNFVKFHRIDAIHILKRISIKVDIQARQKAKELLRRDREEAEEAQRVIEEERRQAAYRGLHF